MLRFSFVVLFSALIGLSMTGCSTGSPDSRQHEALNKEIEAKAALGRLYSHTPTARALAESAAGVLVFPEMTKAGFLVGGQYGNGVLFRHGKVAGFYNSTALSYGLQAGVQQFGYALFLMTEEAIDYLDRSDGWEIGVGPTITVVDQGLAASLTTTTAKSGVYAFFFEQRGLMAGLGIQGTKITRIKP